jgi:hypothetical protein
MRSSRPTLGDSVIRSNRTRFSAHTADLEGRSFISRTVAHRHVDRRYS